MAEAERPEIPIEIARGRRPPDFFVVDEALCVVFRSAGGSEPLAAELGAILRRLQARLDDSEETSAIAVLSATQIVRLLRLASRDGSRHFAVFIERFAARNAIERATSAFGLSARETEVLEGLMHGDSTNEIGRRLGIAATTVKEHVRKIGRKANVTKRSAIVAAVFGLQ